MAILGTTKLTKGGKITLIKDVQERLNLKEGDIIVFETDDKGHVMIRKG
ncbi:looped-hinge helix DNA binding domain, AbrB family [Candidatus Methanoperedens nitroreducens]|uniref:Looped-hinge helix DNA binding domain, AbrB family n=1 Tax=Candidatus Methanoperedens nitratireducens TaxID=1392998 RepID=A0A062V5A3_9EURY|nr:AbrB/MazE/SpoVT family DNA-binding domain-containing protein [Candidatus Methanoperedens nitroreducens]KCZ70954.1 looped-hinge helix DNA binding domain, AbrB family [Candidatus Methanoperedens nitroreducens]MDJ1421677.1 AbrB/MazE/SpoVT family DNA-binding domain-containing protein [Candidatus Methanoperedens sp.]